jgi:hypothetical protein
VIVLMDYAVSSKSANFHYFPSFESFSQSSEALESFLA